MATDTPSIASNRPYGPAANVISVLQRLRSRNMPERISREYYHAAGIPDGSIYRTVFALQFLRLVEDEVPTAALRAIATSTDEEYQAILGGLIREAYSDVFELVDPVRDPQERIAQVFKRYTPASQRARMVLFFLGMCREAGMAVQDAPRLRAASAVAGQKLLGAGNQSRPAGRTVANQRAARLPASSPPAAGSITVAGIPPALELLVRSLPPEGQPLSIERRDQWLAMAEATLKFVYPEEIAVSSVGVDDEQEE